MAENKVLLKAENISKVFCRDLKRSLWYGALDIAKEVFCLDNNKTGLRQSEFWALKDISFELRQGESLGLIGRNGAGKSTLLKLLSGLIKPDSGFISVLGRMGALIELGAGFNPILTARENIYVNAAVLGIPKHRVDLIIDEIIGFAELEEFENSPLQSFSSGMKVRLGFAIASRLSPDLLLIDEVLAVGDLAFRSKCLSRLNEMKKKGVSFILVSHDMTSIIQFTDRAILLEKGGLLMDGPSLEVASEYIRRINPSDLKGSLYGQSLTDHPDMKDVAVELISASGQDLLSELEAGQHARIRFNFKSERELETPNVSFPIYHENGILVTTIASIGRNVSLKGCKRSYSGEVEFGPINLNPGRYVMVANLHDGPEHLFRSVAVNFSVRSVHNKMTWGFIDFDQNWHINIPDLKQ